MAALSGEYRPKVLLPPAKTMLRRAKQAILPLMGVILTPRGADKAFLPLSLSGGVLFLRELSGPAAGGRDDLA